MPAHVEGPWVKGYSKSSSICANRADFALSPVRRRPIDVCASGSFALLGNCWVFGVFPRITPVVSAPIRGRVGAACIEPFCETRLGGFAFFGNFVLLFGDMHGEHVYCKSEYEVGNNLL